MKKIVFYLMMSLVALAFTACEKGDGDADYGFGYIYMPQAMTADGGLNNDYYVPASGSMEYTANYVVTDDKVNVILGVLRSGKIEGQAFSVEIAVNATASATAATAKGGEVMPAVLYELPANVSVEAEKSYKDFYLSLDKAKLADYAGKTLVLNVEIKNPTTYELAEMGTNVNVIVDVDALLALI